MSASAHPRPPFEPFKGLPPIPALNTLRERRQWVSWGYQWKADRQKWDKPPINPHTGRNGSHSDPAQWGSYEQAAARAKADDLDGVGFVLAPDDDLTGFDLDGVRNAESGALLPIAAKVIALGETYCEVSPSGRGLRLFGLGKVEKTTKSDPAGTEIYIGQRYLTVTANHVPGTPIEIRPAPKTLALLLAHIAEVEAMVKADKERVAAAAAAQAAGERANLGGQFRQEQRRQGGKIWEATRDPFWKNVNDAAFGNLDAWVGALFGNGAAKSSKGYRISSASLGRKNEEDLSVTPDGAKDFGVHDQGDAKGGARTAIDLVVEWGSAPDATAAALWLCERLGRDPASLGWRAGQRQGEDGRSTGAGQGDAKAAGATPGPQDKAEKPAVLNDRGVMMGAFRDRLEIALKPEKAPDYPVDRLPTLCADMVQAIADRTQAPVTLCAHSVLSAVALVTQGLADVRLPTGTRAMPLSLFLLAVAASGERKSSCDGLALRAVAELEARLAETYADDMKDYRADRAAYEGEVSKAKADRKLDLEERRQRIRALQEPDEPTAPVIRASEATFEGLTNLMARGRPALGVYSAEGGSFLGGHGLSDDAKVRTITGLSSLYDDGSAQRVRAREITVLPGRRVSISLAAQARVAAALLGDELARDQGFVGRFLVCWPDSRIGLREVRRAPQEVDPRIHAFTDRVRRLLALQEGAQAPLRLPTLEMDDEAVAVFLEFSQAIESNLGAGKPWHPIQATAQRIPENIGRIAGVLHLFAHGGTDEPIGGETMAAACEVGAFYLKEALRMAGGVMVDAETQAVDDLAAWIEGREGDLIAPSHIQRLAPSALRANAARTRERIRALCEAGRLEAVGEGDLGGKHFRELYRVHRKGKR